MNYKDLSLEKRAQWFTKFAENECREVSELYFYLSQRVANDEALLNLAAYCQQRQPMPNLFFGAVHYLLLKEQDPVALSAYYPSLSEKVTQMPPFEIFRTYCLSKERAIKELLTTRLVQTNALNRTAHLMPVIASVLSNGEPVNLVDIGTSAGLILNMDLYEYHYNGRKFYGNSPVVIESEIREGHLSDQLIIPNIRRKTGIDQHPLDLRTEDNALWLQALIWADQTRRLERLRHAITIAKQSDVELLKGQSIIDFEKVLRAQTHDQVLFVYHTHALYQFTKEERAAFWKMLDRLGRDRDFYYLAVEGSGVLAHRYNRKGVLVELTTYRSGVKDAVLLAQTNGHAKWINFIDPPVTPLP